MTAAGYFSNQRKQSNGNSNAPWPSANPNNGHNQNVRTIRYFATCFLTVSNFDARWLPDLVIQSYWTASTCSGSISSVCRVNQMKQMRQLVVKLTRKLITFEIVIVIGVNLHFPFHQANTRHCTSKKSKTGHKQSCRRRYRWTGNYC